MLTPQIIETIVRAALAEDAPWGDITSELLIPAQATATANLVGRESGIFSGGEVFRAAMSVGSTLETTLRVADGESFEAGDVLASVTGSARNVLTAERVALNFVQRMSGIATLTAQYVALTAGTKAQIIDTRKTTPGLRALERHAVRCGGGHNHRYSLSDAVLAKDNHLAVLASHGGMSVTEVLLKVRSQLSHVTHLQVEVDRIDQIEAMLDAGVDSILLDNFTADRVRAAVELVAGRAVLEASGGVNLGTVAALAQTGVDLISAGALTHSVRALDLGLDVEISVAGAAQGA